MSAQELLVFLLSVLKFEKIGKFEHPKDRNRKISKIFVKKKFF